ncbi:MAG: P-loop NTPase, partial [Erysipelotrichaceae bacterium]|nr:P-loop NTPase [Erysipelotrichaceae bacterium]
WEELDVLLIDMPPGTGDVALTIMQSLPVEGVLMVSTPQPMVSMIVEKAIHMCEKMNVPVLGIVENMAYLECPNCKERIEFYDQEELRKFLTRTGVKVYATLPMVDVIRDIALYEFYDLQQRQKTLDLMSEAAQAFAGDLK